MQGHGVRTRTVVVEPYADAPAGVVECWQRRYRCIKCHSIHAVLPAGVMPRFLYSVGAIVMALFLAMSSPIGLGLRHAEAYCLQGLFRGAWRDPLKYRWRSLGRWSALAVEQWWPAVSLCAVLVGFLGRGGTHGSAVEEAIRSQAIWGKSPRNWGESVPTVESPHLE